MNDFYADIGNKVLYDMCIDHPAHVDPDEVQAKLWLIGRAYAATIERGATYPGNVMARSVELLLGSDIDQRIASVRTIKHLERQHLAEVLDLHGYLVDKLKEATGIVKRSLASKYLHFHAPQAFFIYDSIAAGNLRKELKRFRPEFGDDLPGNADTEYARFVLTCLHYRDEILQPRLGGKLVDPRTVDKHLYRRAE